MVRVARVPAGLVDGQQEARAEDDVEFGGGHLLVVREMEEHDVDEPVGRLDLGSLISLEDVLDNQRMEGQGGTNLLGLLGARCRQVHPYGRTRLSNQLREAGEGLRAG